MGVCHILVQIIRLDLLSLLLRGLYSEIFKFFTTLEKNEFSSSATFMSWVKILSFSTNVMFSFDLNLSERREITVFQNVLLSATSFSFQFALYCFLVFLKRLKTH